VYVSKCLDILKKTTPKPYILAAPATATLAVPVKPFSSATTPPPLCPLSAYMLGFFLLPVLALHPLFLSRKAPANVHASVSARVRRSMASRILISYPCWYSRHVPSLGTFSYSTVVSLRSTKQGVLCDQPLGLPISSAHRCEHTGGLLVGRAGP
jgi:hypothetical protein